MGVRSFVVGIVLLIGTYTHAAVMVNTTGSVDSGTGEPTSVNFNITCSASDNMLIIVYGSRSSSSSEVSHTVTYNALSATQESTIWVSGIGLKSTLWSYANPDAVSRNIVCTTDQSRPQVCAAACLSGVDSGTPFGTASTNSDGQTQNDISCSITVAAEGLGIGIGVQRETSGTWSTSDTQEVYDETSHATIANNVKVILASTIETGANSLDWSDTTVEEKTCNAIPVNAAATVGGIPVVFQ